MERIRALQSVFADVDASSIEKWADGFKRDIDPERELEVWERIAAAYKAYCDGKNLSLDAKKDVHSLLLLRSMAPTDEVLNRIQLKELSKEQATAVLKTF